MQDQLRNISIDDDVLVQKCRQDDTEAMGRLIVKYQDRIFNVILKICANYDDAAELTQETFVKVIENIGTFKGKSSFYTWLFRIAVNLTLNYCKRRFKLGTYSLEAPVVQESEGVRGQLSAFLSDESAADPAVIAQQKETGQIVMHSLSKLDDDHRTIIVLRDIEGMSYEQISNILDLELGTVRSRLSRAREKLRQILKAVLK